MKESAASLSEGSKPKGHIHASAGPGAENPRQERTDRKRVGR
ncbi:MAG: hypothetical protein ACRDJ3_08470 [Solirubrobacteraceae bacterium]